MRRYQILKKFALVTLVVITITSMVACNKKKDCYEEYIKGLTDEQYYAEVNIGLENPVLLVTDNVYDDMNGNKTASICADIYYCEDQDVKEIGNLVSEGTSYPLRYDDNSLYEAGNDFGAQIVYNKTTKIFDVVQNVSVEYEEGTGNPTYRVLTNGEYKITTEEEFTKFFDEFQSKKVINFTAVKAK